MFLYTALVHRAIEDMVRVVPALRHIRPQHVAVVAGPRVCRTPHGNLAQCYALNEREVEDLTYWYNPRNRLVLRVTPWGRHENTRVTLHGVPILYVIQLRLPRLLDHDPLETIIHELIHISPWFDGRMRRTPHGKRFDALVAHCAEIWREAGDRRLVEALDSDYETLCRRWGALVAETFGPPFVNPRLRPAPNPPPLDTHPDFRRRRLVFRHEMVKIVPANWTDENIPAHLTERDIAFRVYTREATERISAAAVRAACSRKYWRSELKKPVENRTGRAGETGIQSSRRRCAAASSRVLKK